MSEVANPVPDFLRSADPGLLMGDVLTTNWESTVELDSEELPLYEAAVSPPPCPMSPPPCPKSPHPCQGKGSTKKKKEKKDKKEKKTTKKKTTRKK